MAHPESFYCPIRLCIMKDPVIDKDGNSYEREAIENWLERNEISPITRNSLTMRDLYPNRALKNIIHEASGIDIGTSVNFSSGKIEDKVQDISESDNQTGSVESPFRVSAGSPLTSSDSSDEAIYLRWKRQRMKIHNWC